MSDEQIHQIATLSKAMEVQGNTIKSLEKKLRDAQSIISILEQEKKNWAEQKVIQNRVMQQQLAINDGTVRVLQDQIIELKDRLKVA